jgi:branched-chain amino acid transport system substrate-binding protein
MEKAGMRNERRRGSLARHCGLLGVVAAVAFAAVGCATPGAASKAAPCTAPGVTAGQITLGAIYPNSGSNVSVFSTYRAGLDARFGVANAAGGVNGRKVVYDWADDQGLPTGNLGAARQLVDSDQAFGIMELSTGAAGGAAFLHTQGVPVVGLGLDTVWSTYTNMFSWWNSVSTGAPVTTMGYYVHLHGGTKVAIVYSELNTASRLLTAQWQASLKAYGITAAVIEATPNATSPTDVASRIAAGGYDTIAGTIDDSLFTQIAMAVRQQAPRVKNVLSGDGYSAALLGALGKQLPGFTVAIPYLPFELNAPASTAFRVAMTRYSPQVQPSADQIALDGWLDADLMLTGLKAAGACPARAAFIRGLKNVTNYTGEGLLAAPVDFKTDFGQTSRCLVFVTIDPTGTRWDVVRPAPICGQRLAS